MANSDTGDVAADAYNMYMEDIELVGDLGVCILVFVTLSLNVKLLFRRNVCWYISKECYPVKKVFEPFLKRLSLRFEYIKKGVYRHLIWRLFCYSTTIL